MKDEYEATIWLTKTKRRTWKPKNISRMKDKYEANAICQTKIKTELEPGIKLEENDEKI